MLYRLIEGMEAGYEPIKDEYRRAKGNLGYYDPLTRYCEGIMLGFAAALDIVYDFMDAEYRRPSGDFPDDGFDDFDPSECHEDCCEKLRLLKQVTPEWLEAHGFVGLPFDELMQKIFRSGE